MLSNLAPKARALAEFMSAISEATWCAGWLKDLEYILWSEVVGEGARAKLSMMQVANLQALSDACQGWILFQEGMEETFVPLPEWVRHFALWRAGHDGCETLHV